MVNFEKTNVIIRYILFQHSTLTFIFLHTYDYFYTFTLLLPRDFSLIIIYIINLLLLIGMFIIASSGESVFDFVSAFFQNMEKSFDFIGALLEKGLQLVSYYLKRI